MSTIQRPLWLEEALRDVRGHLFLRKDVHHSFGVWCRGAYLSQNKRGIRISHGTEGGFIPAHGWVLAVLTASVERAEQHATQIVQGEEIEVVGGPTYPGDFYTQAFVWDSVEQDVVSWLDTLKGESHMWAIADVFGYPRSVEVIYKSGTHTEFSMQMVDDGHFHIMRHVTDQAHKEIAPYVEVFAPHTESEASEKLSSIFMQYWTQFTGQPQEVQS